MGKLVRDRIPEIIAAEGRSPQVRRLDDDGYIAALLDKLLEEAHELRSAAPTERIEEAADALEVLLAIVALDGRDPADLFAAAESKREKRGGFVERWWWEPDAGAR